jgi:hypothetical protein
MLDASADTTFTHMRYKEKNQKLKEKFLSSIPLQTSTAAGYLDTLECEIKKLGLPWKTRNWLVGIGTDGAGSMLGQNNRLVAKLKMDMPDLVSTHSIAHRLNLDCFQFN